MTIQSQSKIPYLIGLALVVLVICVASWQLIEGEKIMSENERKVVELPTSVLEEPIIEEAVEEPKIGPQQPIDVVTKEVELERPLETAPIRQLPELDDSDALVKQSLADVLSFNMLKLIINEDLIRRAVVYTENLAEGKLAKKHQVFVAPLESFSVNDGAIITINPKSFKRYDAYVSLLTKLPDAQIIELLNEHKPLINDAYDEIGLSEYQFEQRLALAISHLLQTPEVPLDTPLISQSVSYKYAVPEYEALSDAQKQLLRLGPDNIRKVKTKLAGLLKHL
ncbi:DUF3014 domain-containing protein [Pseudoalteromonas sp.]|uniref:DUF3014 domain-containing protein n=1 Tax=Pseudoalteromonas sp. TaxID=53249 RepID=UPI0035677CD4